MGELDHRAEPAFVWPRVNILAPGAVRRWLVAGWADLTAAPVASLFYGVVLPMLTWAASIVLFAGLGFASYCVGLVVAVPLIGHMTWHAYRETISPLGR